MRLFISIFILHQLVVSFSFAADVNVWSVTESKGTQRIMYGQKIAHEFDFGQKITGLTWSLSADGNKAIFVCGHLSKSSSLSTQPITNKYLLLCMKNLDGTLQTFKPNCEHVVVREVAGIFEPEGKDLSIAAMIDNNNSDPNKQLYRWVKLKWSDISKPCAVESLILKN
jgi:hypothetical protein